MMKTNILKIIVLLFLINMAFGASSQIDTTAKAVVQEQINGEEATESFMIEVKPEFPGGDAELIKYVAKSAVYPKIAKENGIQGTVYVRFVVTKTGGIANAKVMRSVDPILEEEALRVINSLPTWKPGMNGGKPVNVWFIIPVQFKL